MCVCLSVWQGNLVLATELITWKSFKADVPSVNPSLTQRDGDLSDERWTLETLETSPLNSLGFKANPKQP